MIATATIETAFVCGTLFGGSIVLLGLIYLFTKS
jgi:hypothetical protein